MASLHKDPRGKSPYWYCAFTLPDGRRTFRSTKLTDRKKALGVCLEWEKSVAQGRDGSFTEAQARKVLNTILENTGQAPMQTETIDGYFNNWINGKELANKPRTAERYRIVVKRFLDSLGQKARRPLGALTVRDLENFRNQSMDEGKAPKTTAFEIKILRSVLNVARRQGRITTNPAEAVELPKIVSNTRDVFTPEQVRMLLAAADEEWQTVILAGFYLGARLSDVINLTWENVDLTGGVMTYEQGKTGKSVTTPLHPDLKNHLFKLAGDNPRAPLCPMLQKRSVSGRAGLSVTFANIMRDAGIGQQQVKGKGKQGRMFSKLSFHSLRHTFTSALANANVPAEVRQKLTGHADAATHQGYTHLELQPLEAAIAKLPSVSKS
ncbi:MAG TPA: tyrosine-type recombinase/integrase [Verrucomicrobiae bacterium]|nr:tyrosine-type recombinase/integrase [Verrucomicrobiae bacterium]